MSKIRAMIWVATTAAIKIGSERSYKAPAITPSDCRRPHCSEYPVCGGPWTPVRVGDQC
jgi:hypothetical protein